MNFEFIETIEFFYSLGYVTICSSIITLILMEIVKIILRLTKAINKDTEAIKKDIILSRVGRIITLITYGIIYVIDVLIIKHNELTAEEFIYLWESVWGNGPSIEQTKLAMDNTLFRVSIFDGEKIVAMARVIGDMGLCYYIKDVIVLPEYQGKGIGRMLIDELLKFVNQHGIPDTHIFVELCAMPDKIPFYEKFGFSANEAQRLRIMYHVLKES